MSAPDGLLLVDKPSGWTSHDVVARTRRLAATRRVGHAGTLDPMATGLLILGIGRATRLLGHLALHDKDYAAGITLGAVTNTDDAGGEVVSTSSVDVSESAVRQALSALTGSLMQVPPAYSAIKVDGRRSYARARSGETVELAARPVEVTRFELVGFASPCLDAVVTCSSGTYVRALARDLGAALGCGAHLASLRRTRIGGFTSMTLLDELSAAGDPDALPIVPLADAIAAGFPRRELSDAETIEIRHGRPLAPTGAAGPVGVFAPDGTALALVEDRAAAGGVAARPLVVFAPA